MNPYLVKLRARFAALGESIATLQNAATAASRDLTDDEYRSLVGYSTEQGKLVEQINALTDVENRSAAVAAMGARIAGAIGTDAAAAVDAGTTPGGTDSGAADSTDSHNRAANAPTDTAGTTAVGGATTTARDPGHYRSAKDGGTQSIFRDLYRAKEGDEEATKRLSEHNRALSSGGAGAGVVPPKWLLDEYAPLMRQGRSLANAVRTIPIGMDPTPLTLPKQTTGADVSNPARQTAENDPTPSADKWASSVDTVSPTPVRGKQIVSRQMLDMARPAVDLLIFGDMIADYNRQIESGVAVALVASATLQQTFANEAAFKGTAPAVPAGDAIIDSAVGVWNARKLPANILVMGIPRWGRFKKLRDTTGRKLIPEDSAGAFNVEGVGEISVPGQIEGLGIVVTESTAIGVNYPDTFVVARAQDVILFEGDLMRFRYEERSGPESIELGIWAYSAITVRYAGSSAYKVVITAA